MSNWFSLDNIGPNSTGQYWCLSCVSSKLDTFQSDSILVLLSIWQIEFL